MSLLCADTAERIGRDKSPPPAQVAQSGESQSMKVKAPAASKVQPLLIALVLFILQDEHFWDCGLPISQYLINAIRILGLLISGAQSTCLLSLEYPGSEADGTDFIPGSSFVLEVLKS